MQVLEFRPSPSIDEQKERSNVSQPNAFAAAAAQMSNQQSAAPAQQYIPDTSGNLTESFVGQGSQLFSGPVMPSSLFNKTHGLGTSRTGKITVAPYDVQSRDFRSKLPKFWANTPVIVDGKPRKVTTNTHDHVTGEALRPVLDTMVILATEYRFDAAECAAIERDATLPDDGTRAAYVSGDDLKQLKSEIRRIGGIRSEEDMVGLTFTMTRVGQKPNPGANPSWINKIELSR
jgi:hypothetical protein